MKVHMSFFKKNSMRYKLLWGNGVIITLALILVFIVTIFYVNNIFKNMILEEMSSGSEITKVTLDEIFEKYNGAIKSIETDDRIYRFVADDSGYNWEDAAVLDKLNDYTYVCQILTNIREAYDIYDIEIIGGSEYCYTSRGAVKKMAAEEFDNQLRDYTKNNKGYGFWGSDSDESDLMFYCKSIAKRSNYRECIGLIKIYIEKDYVRSILENSKCDTENLCILYNSDGKLIVSTEDISSNETSIVSKNHNLFIENADGLSNLEFSNKKYTVYKCNSGYDSLIYVSVMPMRAVTDKFAPIAIFFVALILVILAISLLTHYKVIFKITKGLSKLVDSMVNVKDYRFDYVEYDENDGDEIVQCIKNYNFMLDDLKKLFEAEKRLRYLEQKLLVEQVNPHFFYNTLEMINDLAYKNGVDEISNLLQYLSKFYRHVLNDARDVHSLKDELDTAETYCMIQKFRFDNAVDLVIDVDDSLMNIKVIKMLIQPVIENAIKYNVKYKKQYDLTLGICIIGYIEGDYIVISIEDDGTGIEETRCKGLLDKGSKNFGLKNLNERIKSFYGDDCGITIESRYGLGTTVKLYIKKEILN